MKKILPALMSVGLLSGSMAAHAIPYGFTCVTNNNPTNCTTGESQLRVDVTAGAGTIDFLFTNTGPNASSIADIYFDWLSDDEDFLTLDSIVNGSGVSFSEGASPGNLPGGNTISFDADFGADSNAPAQPNGVNPGENVLLRFLGPSFDTVIASLDTGDLRIGLHVQGFAGGGSDSFVNDGRPPTSVPEPGTLALFGLGLVGLGLIRRRRSV
jgi:PEP-CTERM motif